MMFIPLIFKYLFCEVVEAQGKMYNIKMPAFNGEIFWDTIDSCEGFKLQQHKYTQHCRILNYKDERVSWGSRMVMEQEMRKMHQMFD